MSRKLKVCTEGELFNNWKFVGEAQQVGRFRRWRIQCTNCGNTRVVNTGVLASIEKHRYGCSCYLMPKGESGLNALLHQYKKGAKKRGLDFLLTKEQFRQLTSASCFYCGASPQDRHCVQQTKKRNVPGWGDYCYNGVDRTDNNKGYTIENCVTCCNICNRAKLKMGYEDFIVYLTQLTTYRTRAEWELN